MDYLVVITTCGSQDEAENLASQIIKSKLAACVQLSNITSYYIWDGEVNNDPEVKLLIKTRKALYDQLEAMIKNLHSYDVPEIIALPVLSGLKDYLDWIDEVTE